MKKSDQPVQSSYDRTEGMRIVTVIPLPIRLSILKSGLTAKVSGTFLNALSIKGR